jgi:hypothetical protein
MGMARKAKEFAEVLLTVYADRKNHFILTKKEFKAISGKGKMRKKYLVSVDARLRKQGYVLIDLHKERQMIGVLPIETVAQWDIPELYDDTHDRQFAEHDDESDREEKTPRLDTSF